MGDPTVSCGRQFQNVIGEDLSCPPRVPCWRASTPLPVGSGPARGAVGRTWPGQWTPPPAGSRSGGEPCPGCPAGHLRRLADVIADHAGELAELEARDNGASSQRRPRSTCRRAWRCSTTSPAPPTRSLVTPSISARPASTSPCVSRSVWWALIVPWKRRLVHHLRQAGGSPGRR